MQPVFLIKSPEVARQILIKDFNHFTDHRRSIGDTGMFGNCLISLEGEKWRNMRNNLSPAFTGNKMRSMFELINEISQQAAAYMKENEIGKDVNVKDYFSRFANDVIASTVFGFKMNSLEDKDNKFFKVAQHETALSFVGFLKALLLGSFNKFARFIGIKMMGEEHENYYMKLVLDTMKYRTENKLVRHDIINMLMEVKGISVEGNAEHKSHINWSDKEIVAQCFQLLFAGFETVSTTLSFTSHELMENQDIQNKLKEEIQEIKESLNGGPLTYEAVANMKYTEAVILESLRKWPTTLPLVDRMCTKDIDLKDPESGKVIKLKAGDQIQVSAVGIHRDPQYYPDPMKFDPDRFSEENKKHIHPNTFMGFGMGPRMCIGNRFAMMEMKSLLYYLIQDISFKPSVKSSIPLVLDPRSGQAMPKGGIWVKVISN